MNAVMVHVCGYDVLVGDGWRGLECGCLDKSVRFCKGHHSLSLQRDC